jgi:predicted Zn-dependent peptidase
LGHTTFERHRLDNGLRIILAADSAAPIVGVNLWYDVGSRNEKAGKTGFAHLFEHMMFQGSANVAKGEHFATVQAAGGTLNASTWCDRTNYFETVPSHELEMALWLEAERLANLLPAMTQEKLDNQRDVVKNERRWSVDNQPYGTWDERIQAHIYPVGHPYHHSTIGSMEDLSAASLEDVEQFFATYYAPNNGVLTIAGDFDPDAALAAIERHFGPIPANPDLPPGPDGALPELLGAEVREIVPDAVELPRVYVAYRIPPYGTDAFLPFELASDLLATGRAARLYRHLVRERRLAQDVTASVFPFAHGAAVLVASATARPEIEIEALEEALLGEIAALALAGPTEDELARVRTLHTSAVERNLEEVGEVADRLSMYGCLFDEPERINREEADYDAVGSEQIRAAMSSHGGANNRVVLTFVPNGESADDDEEED